MHAVRSIAGAARLDDEELLATVERLLQQERSLGAQLLVHLAEIEHRQLYLQHAYGSMFEYCVKALHLSEAEAYLRIGAARLGRRFPRVLEMLAAGELHLSALKLLAPVLDDDNCEQLISVARFKSKRELEQLLTHHRPQPDVPNAIRKLPRSTLVPKPTLEEAQVGLLSSPASGPVPSGEGQAPATAANVATSPLHVFQSAPTAKPRPTLSPLGTSRYKVQFTASQQLHDKLRQAQELLRHELPGGDLAQVVEHALDLHHEEPFGRGGPSTTGNIRVLCRAHNRWLAEHDYGSAFIDQRIARARREQSNRQRVPERDG